jgi:uncharacterized protein (DUF169 family)
MLDRKNIANQAEKLTSLLSLSIPPLAITFSSNAPAGIARFHAPMPPPAQDGRTGRVSAGCVFWIKAREKSFTTAPEDHGNCSVGSLTHGFKTLAQTREGADVVALLKSGWISQEVLPEIPTVKGDPGFVTYGPLAEAQLDPDIVFLYLNGKQVMILHDAWPELRFEGKPQCHIIPIAKEVGDITISVGCMLSRVRTGMSNNDITCAVPFGELPNLIDRLGIVKSADLKVAAYASEDAKRFA